MPAIDEPSGGFTCPACGVKYEGWPGKHVCPDGTTHSERIRSAYSGNVKLYDKYDLLELTEDDKKLLKGMKIKI